MNERALTLTAGNPIAAVVPSTIEDVWRISQMYIESGMAPEAITGRPPAVIPDNPEASKEAWRNWAKNAASAVSVVVMSGLELGLKPMVALRSFTVINNKPALYGDGPAIVIRQTRRADFIKSGHNPAASDEFLRSIKVDEDVIASLTTPDQRNLGWCYARRADTGEEKTEIFSVHDAKTAGLLPVPAVTRGKVWSNQTKKMEWADVPNPAPWHRYPQRMLMWRASGFCLRGLFSDVLGGVLDEFEAQEIADVTRREEPPAEIEADTATAEAAQPKKPPLPPMLALAGKPAAEAAAAEAKPVEEEQVAETAAATTEDDASEFDFGQFFSELEEALQSAKSEDELLEIWDGFDVEATFTNDADTIEICLQIRDRIALKFNPMMAG